jgi:uncharacterized protein
VNLLERVLNFNLRHKWLGVSVALALSLLGISFGTDLPIRLSLQELLPPDRQSVVDFNAVAKDVGGVGYLGVLIGPVDNPESYIPSVAAALRGHRELKYVFWEREGYSLRRKALYLLPRTEFDELIRSAEMVLFEGKEGGFLDLGLEEDTEREQKVKEAEAFFERLRAERTGGKAGMEARDQRYFLSKDGRYAMIFAKPTFDSEDLGRSTKLIEEVRTIVDKNIAPGTPYNLWGRYLAQVQDTQQIRRDIALTSVISLTLIALVLIWGLGSIRGALVTVACVALSMGWTVGFAHVAVGQINIITGFLLAILGGLGVEYGVHLLRRYYQERGAGQRHEAALKHSYVHVGRALLSAALTSAGAFFILAFSDFRGFSELGKIAGFGILSIYCVYILCFPAIGIVLRERQRFTKSLEIFGFYPFTLKWRWLYVPALVIFAFGLTRAEFEYDFERMRELSKQTVRLNKIVGDLMGGRSVTPAALLAESPEQSVKVYDWLLQDKFKPSVDDVVSLHTLVPLDMSDRFEALDKFRKNLKRVSDEDIRSKTGMEPKLVRSWVDERPYTRSDLPVQLRGAFGQSGNIVLVYTSENLSHATGLRRFSGVLDEARANFSGLRIGSDAGIFVEILDHVINDGRIVMLLFLLGSFFVLWLDFRSIREALGLEMQLILGIALLVALMGFFHVPFSILNIAMVPAVLAAGIDIGVHVRHRDLESRKGALLSARFVAQAVQLSVLTTMIGFGSLFLSQAGMLKGIAWISVLGQVSMYFICMVLWPMGVDWFRSLRPQR